jgi:glycosyltransferase involved in cell wall biosynthesis
MRLCLTSIGDDSWIAGVYYITNLARALASLPATERPNIHLLVPPQNGSKYYQDLVGLAEIFEYRQSAEDLLARQRLANRFLVPLHKALISRCPDILLGWVLRKKLVSLIFPFNPTEARELGVAWLPWVFDMQHRRYPDFFSHEERENRDRLFKDVAQKAKVIVVSSKASLDDFARFAPQAVHKLRMLQFATFPTPDWYAGNAIATCQRYGLPDHYLMIPNQFWVHKNHRTAFEALRILVDRGVDAHLVCTGNVHDHRRPGHFKDLSDYISTHSLEHRIRILGLIPRYDQIQIIRRSAALIQPSLFEGWSTVVEDGRALGKKMFLSDLPVHREQGPSRSLYFDPEDACALADKIERVWPDLRPGPSGEHEQAALEKQHAIVTNYARNFMSIAQEVVQSYDQPSWFATLMFAMKRILTGYIKQ